jgi:glycosyltransferase involved in cell wall biosynthesis/predicted O-methyltransferase YrrM
MDFETLYDQIVPSLQPGAIIVEVGSYFGRSAVYMAELLADREMEVEFYAVDVWNVSTYEREDHTAYHARFGSQWDAFQYSIQSAGLEDRIKPMRMPSTEAAAKFADESIDFLFLDADHEYPGVSADMAAWWPKVKVGGIMAGHDYHGFPGVERAVRERFGHLKAVHGNCWMVTKTPAAPNVSVREGVINALDLSIVIPTYNKVELTAQCFASIARNVGRLKYEIIVVDNGSTDATNSFVGSHVAGQIRGAAQGTPPKKVTLLHNEVPRLLARSWNMGVDAARGRQILITNNDVLFSPGSLESMVWLADINDSAGVVLPLGPRDVAAAPRIERPDTSDTPVDTSIRNMEAVEKYWVGHKATGGVQYLSDPYVPQGGYCFVLTRRAWEATGRFDEEYDLTAEDWDYFARMRRHYKLTRSTDAYVEHFEHSSCMDLGLEFHERLCRNRFRLTEKNEHCYEMFSIVMPTYNRVDALRPAIDSVLAQTFPHWRLYIIDDGSTNWDEIQALSKEYALAANRIWWFHRPKNEGPGSARNWGLSYTRGKYVAFLDSDDLWYRDHLQAHWDAHENGQWAMVYSDPDFAWRWWDKSVGRFLYQSDKHPFIDYLGGGAPWSPELLRQRCYIQTSAVSVWGNLARSLRFPEHMRVEEDWEYFKATADVFGPGRPVLHLPRKTCRYHIARNPHEEDHLTRGFVPQSVDSPKPRLMLDRPVTGEIGVVTPTKERPCCLPRAISSAGAVPVVVVDDGSMVATEAFDICERSPNVSLLRFDRSQGASAARNIGVDRLQTEWVQFLDDDDVLTADWLARLRPHMVAGVDVIIGAAYVPGERGLAVNNDVFTSQICVRRSWLIDAGGFRSGVAWMEERELIERLQAMGANVVREPVPTVTRPARGGSGDPATVSKPAPVPASGRRVVGRFGGKF